jgi:hypothetical protein
MTETLSVGPLVEVTSDVDKVQENSFAEAFICSEYIASKDVMMLNNELQRVRRKRFVPNIITMSVLIYS